MLDVGVLNHSSNGARMLFGMGREREAPLSASRVDFVWLLGKTIVVSLHMLKV